jgi:hypothetical protein
VTGRPPATDLVTPAPVIPRPDDYDRGGDDDCRRDVPRSRGSDWHDRTAAQRRDKYCESESEFHDPSVDSTLLVTERRLRR